MHKEPSSCPNLQTNLRWLSLGFLSLWAFYFLFFIAIGILAQWFPQLVFDELRQDGILDLLENEPLRLVLMAVVIAPIYEEVLFRSLVRPGYGDLLLFLSGLASLATLFLLGDAVAWYVRLGCAIACFMGTFYLLQVVLPRRSVTVLLIGLRRAAVLILIISSVLFGLVHIYNYVDTFTLSTALLAAIVPRIALGIVAGWLKLKSGILLLPILLHFLNNGVVIGFLLVSAYSTAA
jgi:membrane protease YdiL (CAAX protease family)